MYYVIFCNRVRGSYSELAMAEEEVRKLKKAFPLKIVEIVKLLKIYRANQIPS